MDSTGMLDFITVVAFLLFLLFLLTSNEGIIKEMMAATGQTF